MQRASPLRAAGLFFTGISRKEKVIVALCKFWVKFMILTFKPVYKQKGVCYNEWRNVNYV